MAKLVDQMMKDVLGNVLEKLEHYKESKSDIENEIDSAIDMLEKEIKEEFVSDGKAWDFSKERGEAVFAEDDEIFLCPITEEYYEAYFKTRKEYLTLNIFEKFNVTVDDFFGPELKLDKRFSMAVIQKKDNAYLGYVGINDTTRDLWELCVEFLPQHCHKGYGYRALKLFIKRLFQITGKEQFTALVEVDNIPSQKLMRKFNGRLIGLHDYIFHDEEQATRFEERHMDKITPHMVELAEELMVEPRKLLSHVLDFRIFADKL